MANNKGKEIDVIVEFNGKTMAVELKSGKTYTSRFADNLAYWQDMSSGSPSESYVVYAGNQKMKIKYGNLLPWNRITDIIELIK